MTVINQTTDKRADNTNPETPRLLLEGIVDIPVADYYAYGGGYITIYSLNITELNDLGNRVKGFTPESLEIKCWKTTMISGGGQINDYFYPMPFTTFNNFATGEVNESALVNVINQYIIGDGLHISLMEITHYMDTLPTLPQSFSYKIYSTIYPFTDTYS